jgi:hypothetical protein
VINSKCITGDIISGESINIEQTKGILNNSHNEIMNLPELAGDREHIGGERSLALTSPHLIPIFMQHSFTK